MSANLAKQANGDTAMAYVSGYGKPWHKDGTAVEGLMTTQEALSTTGLDFDVEKCQTQAKVPAGFEEMNGEQVPIFEEVEGPFFYTVRMDTKKILGCVGRSYEVIQTRDAVKFFDEILGEDAYCIDTVGALDTGGRIWLAARMPDSFVIKGDDVIDRYIMLTVGHDGHWGINAIFTGIRPVCENTVSAALKGAKKQGRQIIKVKHTSNAQKNLKTAIQLAAQEKHYWDALGKTFKHMASVELTSASLESFVGKLFPTRRVDDEGVAVTAKQTKDRRDFVTWAFEHSPGAELAGKTIWGAYNAATWWADHSAEALAAQAHVGMPEVGARKVKGSAWGSTTFGSGAKFRQKALDAALSMV